MIWSKNSSSCTETRPFLTNNPPRNGTPYSPLLASLPWSNPRATLSSPQTRTFVTQLVQNFQLKRLEHQANQQASDVHVQHQLIQELFQKRQYDAVIQRMTHPSFQHLRFPTDSWILFLHAVLQTNRRIKWEDVVKKVTQNSPLTEESLQEHWNTHKLHHQSQPEKVQALLHLLQNNGAATVAAINPLSGGVPALSRGYDPRHPIHVQIAQPPARNAVLGFVARAALFFVAFSAVGALLDERGIGRGLGGIGGATGSNSKHIQEATHEGKTVKFDDVKGVTEAKAELEEIVMYLKDPSKFTRLGGKLPRGLLLTGPPGTGKTLLAKAIAGEADVPFFYSSGSQFEEVYVGLGAKRIRELFEAAKKKAPAIIFIDEIDAVGGTRKLKDQSALKMTLNELLVQLDGFDENNGIIVIGATNFMESLDPALLRPGRFDKHVVVPLPDVGGRKEILEMYSKKTQLDKDVDLNVLARGTTGFSGADLYNLMNQAALKASVDGLNAINMSTLEYAKDKIIMGAERKSAVITKESARCTAYHEAGHAVVAVLTEGAMPVHKATIMPRGRALGMVSMLPEGDQTSQSLKEMFASMDVAMGGRVAEELTFGKEAITSGASSDIQHATRVARNMVTKWGFSDEVGIVYHGGDTGEESASNETRGRIDSEVKKLTQDAYKRAKDLLNRYSYEHKLLAETLLEYETLTGDEVRDIVKKRKKPNRPVINKDGGSRGDTSVVSSSSSKRGGRRGKGTTKFPGFGSDRSPQ